MFGFGGVKVAAHEQVVDAQAYAGLESKARQLDQLMLSLPADLASQLLQHLQGAEKGMGRTADSLTALRHDLDSISDSSQQLSTIADQSSSSAAATMDTSRQSIADMKQLSSNIEASSRYISEFTSLLESLEGSNKTIIQLVESIKAIADQTNLLALNAAIEAARAGEHGRGFAVVADEVRQLANTANESAEQIQSEIKKINDISGLVIDKQQEVAEVIGSSVTIAGETVRNLDELMVSAKTTAAAAEAASADFSILKSQVEATGANLGDFARSVQNAQDELAGCTDISHKLSTALAF